MRKKLALVIASLTLCFLPVSAQFSLGSIFGEDSTLGNIVEGIFTKSDITVSDLVGQYKGDGPAVCFKSENFLKKAGGIAASAALESKLKPYYDKLGLDNLELTINADSTFTAKVKGITLSGNISHNVKDGTFEFSFMAMRSIRLGSMTAYIQKSVNSVDIMFDATKLKNFLAEVAKIVPINGLKTIGSLLESYDGACIGAKMIRTSSARNNASYSDDNSRKSSGQQAVDTGISILRDTLGKKKK